MKVYILLFTILICTLPESIAQWAELEKFPGHKRSKAFSFEAGGKAYMGTGYREDRITNHNGEHLGGEFIYYHDFWEFDPSTGKWTQKKNFPGHARYNAHGFSAGGKGYAGFGFYREIVGEYNEAFHPVDLWQYDPEEDEWTRKKDFPGSQRSSSVAFSIDDKIYVGLGIWDTFLKDFWCYDTKTDEWVRIADFPGIGRNYATAFVVNGKAYVGGGTADRYQIESDFWEYDPQKNTWKEIAPFPEGEGKIWNITFTIYNKGVIGAGSEYGTAPKTDFKAYDPLTDKWHNLRDSLPGGRKSPVAFVLNSTPYIATGGGTSVYDYYNDVYKLDANDLASLSIDKENEQGLKIFPNPTATSVTIEGNIAGASLSVTDINGKEVLYHRHIQDRHEEIRLSEFSPGIYFIRIRRNDDVVVEKLVVR